DELVEHGVPADLGVDDLSGDVPLAEAGDPDLLSDLAVGAVEVLGELLGGDLDGQLDAVLAGMLDGGLQGPSSVAAIPDTLAASCTRRSLTSPAGWPTPPTASRWRSSRGRSRSGGRPIARRSRRPTSGWRR